MDTDGVQDGFDCALTRAVSRATHIPVIASGGAGKPEDFVRVLTDGEADAALAASIFHYGTYTVDELKEDLEQARHPGQEARMIIPCIDLMDGKVVQLVQGREKALEGAIAAGDAATVRGLPGDPGDRPRRRHRQRLERRHRRAARRHAPLPRVGGGVRTPERARDAGRAGRAQGDRRHRGVHRRRHQCSRSSRRVRQAVGRERLIDRARFKGGRIVVKGWRESTDLDRRRGASAELEPYCCGFLCTYVDKEGMLQGTDLDWFRRLRAATSLELTAAGGITTLDEVRALLAMNVHAALGMAIYTGRLDLRALAGANL